MVFLIVTGDFVKTGGMDRANYALAEYLLKTGHDVHVVAYRVAPQLLACKNFFFHRAPKIFGSYYLSHFVLDLLGRFWAKKIKRLGGRVIVNGGNCLWGDVNWVHYVHAAFRPSVGTEGFGRRVKNCMDRLSSLAEERIAFQKAGLIIANSLRTRSDVLRYYGADPLKVHCVYYGTDPAQFSVVMPEEKLRMKERYGFTKDLYAVFIGALSDRRKGFDLVFEAWRRLRAEAEWDVHLLVIGQGREVDYWQTKAVSAGLEGMIIFLGFRSDVADILKCADILVSPTRYEAFGLAVQEALCSGLPAAVSRDAGVAELYPSHLKEMLIDSLEDASPLMQCLLRWRGARGPFQEKFCALGERLRARSWDMMAREIMDLVRGCPGVAAEACHGPSKVAGERQ